MFVVVVPGPVVVVPPPVFIGVVIGVDVVPPVPVFVVVPLPPLLPVCVEGVLPGRELLVRHSPRWFGAAAVPNGQSPSGDCTCFEQVVAGRLGTRISRPYKTCRTGGDTAGLGNDFTSGVTNQHIHRVITVLGTFIDFCIYVSVKHDILMDSLHLDYREVSHRLAV